MKLSVLLMMQIIIVVKVYADCARPTDVVQFEKECFDETADLIEKVQQKATSFFESAKKKLGIATDDDAEQKPKRCEYYQCVLKRMHVTNQHGLPEVSTLTDRYRNQLPENMEQVHDCFKIAENVEQMMHSEEDTVAAINSDNTKTIKQARDTMNEILCEINSQVVRCLSQLTYKANCKLLMFP